MLKFYNIKDGYIDYLKQFDSNIMVNSHNSIKRPYVGILISINDLLYYAPMISPKPKHVYMNNTIDFFKINNGKYGAINLNNMIPVNNKLIDLIDIKSIKKYNLKYSQMLSNQYVWLNNNNNANIVIKRANRLYKLFVNHKLNINIKNRCCNFTLLEQKAQLYIPILYVYQNKQNSLLELFTEENNSSDYNLIYTYNVSQNEIGKLPIDKYNDYINTINQIKHYYKDENSFTSKQLSKISDIGIEKATIELKGIAKSFNNQISIKQNNNTLKP